MAQPKRTAALKNTAVSMNSTSAAAREARRAELARQKTRKRDEEVSNVFFLPFSSQHMKNAGR